MVGGVSARGPYEELSLYRGLNFSDPFGLCSQADGWTGCDATAPNRDPRLRAQLEVARQRATANTWAILGIVDVAQGALRSGVEWAKGLLSEASAARSAFSFNAKIAKQIGSRGWSVESIDATIASPARTQLTRDVRNLGGGRTMNDPATAYFDQGGSYVVRNDVTHDIVQASNRNDPGWITVLPPR